jgi:hypothetical protein
MIRTPGDPESSHGHGYKLLVGFVNEPWVQDLHGGF